MVEIICSPKEFHRYIGPRIRNMIQALTKKRKKEINHICQECKKHSELEAAHIRGNSRKDIIEKILKKYIINFEKMLIKIDLEKIEQEIIEAHKPIDTCFRFLCAKCHIIYDSDVGKTFKKEIKEIDICPTLTTSPLRILIDNRNKKVYKIIK